MDIKQRTDVYLSIILPSSLGLPAKAIASYLYLGDGKDVLNASYADLQKATGLSKSGVINGVKELVEKFVIEKEFDPATYKNQYKIPSIFITE